MENCPWVHLTLQAMTLNTATGLELRATCMRNTELSPAGMTKGNADASQADGRPLLKTARPGASALCLAAALAGASDGPPGGVQMLPGERGSCTGREPAHAPPRGTPADPHTRLVCLGLASSHAVVHRG